MSERRPWKSIRGEGRELIERVKAVVREGNVRRIVVKQENQVIAEFPMTVGVLGAVLAPPLAAIGTLVALLSHCTIEVERTEKAPAKTRRRSRKARRSAKGTKEA